VYSIDVDVLTPSHGLENVSVIVFRQQCCTGVGPPQNMVITAQSKRSIFHTMSFALLIGTR